MIVCLFIFLLLTVLLIVDFSIKFVFYLINLLIIYLLVLIPVDEEIKILCCSFYIDILSLSLVILSLYLIFLIIMSRHGVKKRINFFALYSCIIIILLLTLLLRFFRINFLSFYFFFEFSLIPTIIIIIGWVYQPERLQVGIYFILYTLLSSLLFLLYFFLIYIIFYIFLIFSFFYSFIKLFRLYIICLRILGIVFIGVSCCRINDMKALVAYSSVAHMGLVLSGLLTFYT